MSSGTDLANEVRLTVGELKEILDQLPDWAEVSFGSLGQVMQFHRLLGSGENTVVIELRQLGPKVEYVSSLAQALFMSC